MHKLAERLSETVEENYCNHRSLPEEYCAIQLSDDQWSLKEIFGHLVDSAANNHQRFVRMQDGDLKGFPGYHFNWVRTISYNKLSFSVIMDLWKNYNLLLAHIIRHTEKDALKHCWETEDDTLSLKFLMEDYLDHMEQHLQHLEERKEQLRKAGYSPFPED